MTLVTLENLKVLVEKKMVATLYILVLADGVLGLGFEHFPTRLLGWWNLRFNGGKAGRFLHRNKAASRKYHSTD